jgi:hypothetical protein
LLKCSAVVGLIVAILAVCLFIPSVLAHAPLGTQDNESIDTATVIPDPTKSWALYAELHSDGEPQYYTFNISEGQTIDLLMYKSLRSQDADFEPTLVLMGQTFNATSGVPSKITVPAGYNAEIIHPIATQASYEPFSPGVLGYVANLTITDAASGQYYMAVYEASDNPKGGNYGIAIGDRETYTIDEWVLIPYNLLSIYQWEGQSLTLILAPMVATLIVGIILVAWKQRKQHNLASPMAWLASIAGLTFVGTAASTLYQILFCAAQVPVGTEVIITLVFAIIPLILGLLTLRLALRTSPSKSIRKRVYFVVLGVAALFIWAGYIIGPILAIVVALMPNRLKRQKQQPNKV